MPNEQVKIRSYNSDEHPDEIAELQDISVLGKVFWYSVLLQILTLDIVDL